MRYEATPYKFASEAEICERFIALVPEEWTVYPETAGFDMVLVHTSGTQIAVEAKPVLNVKVLQQILDRRWRCESGPDFRAVLVGRSQNGLDTIANRLGVTVIEIYGRTPPIMFKQGPVRPKFEYRPALPDFLEEAAALARARRGFFQWMSSEDWFDEAPSERLKLPDYVPDVAAGVPSPMVFGDWKIKAIKVCVWVETMGVIERRHFKDLGINPSRWMDGFWLKKSGVRGVWKAGPGFPAETFRRQHPGPFKEIEADWDVWSAKMKPTEYREQTSLMGDLLEEK